MKTKSGAGKARTKKSPSKSVGTGDGSALFEAVQGAQGYAFLSDDGDNLPPDQVLERAKASLHWTNETAKILRRFIREHSPNDRDVPTSGTNGE